MHEMLGEGLVPRRHVVPLLYEQVAKRIANIIDIVYAYVVYIYVISICYVYLLYVCVICMRYAYMLHMYVICILIVRLCQ